MANDWQEKDDYTSKYYNDNWTPYEPPAKKESSQKRPHQTGNWLSRKLKALYKTLKNICKASNRRVS